MKYLIIPISLLFLLIACKNPTNTEALSQSLDTTASKIKITAMLDSFNIAAANADFDLYFNYFADDAVFIGTDATEHWNKQAFMNYAKPHFESKKTWNFKSLKRNVYFTTHADIAWFDELLDTQMKICRGSGVLVKINNNWKVQQYVLSTTVPNELIDTLIKIKSPMEDKLISDLKQ